MTRSRLFVTSAVAAAAALAWLYLRDAPLRAGLATDVFHHLAAVRELAKGEFPPRHNLVVEDGLPQGHYGPYLVLLGAVSRLTGASPRVVLYVAGVANLLAFVWGLALVAGRLLGDGAARWAPLAGVLLWGPWPGREVSWPSWQWPGTTSLAEAQNFFYPHQAGLVLLLFLLAVLLRPEPLSPRRAALGIGLMAALVATHPLTALAMLPALGALVATRVLGREARRAHIAFLVALPLLGLAVACLWPYYPVLGLLKAASHPGLREPVASPAAVGLTHAAAGVDASGSLPILAVLGPTVIGVAAAAGLAWRGRPFLLLWLLADLALAFCPLLPLRQRFVLFAVLPAQIAAMGLLEEAQRAGRVLRAVAIAVLVAGALSAGERIRWLLDQEVPDLGFVARLTPEDAIVLSDPATSNGVAGLAGRKVVAPQHPDLFLVAAGGWQRVLDVAAFLDPRTDSAARQATLTRWRATHVLIDRIGGGPTLPYPVIYEGGGYVLYEVPRPSS